MALENNCIWALLMKGEAHPSPFAALSFPDSKKEPIYKWDGDTWARSHDLPATFCTMCRNDLKWDTHVSNICTKANRTLAFLRRNLVACPRDVKESAYKGLIRPILEYGSSIWDPKVYFFKKNLRRFRKEQLDL